MIIEISEITSLVLPCKYSFSLRNTNVKQIFQIIIKLAL